MKITNRIKAGASVAPASLIILYYLFFLLDIITTYLATPDMKYEGNWLVRVFNFNWSQFIVFYSFIIFIVTYGLLLALSYIHSYYSSKLVGKDSLHRELIINIKLLLSLIVLGSFYSHLLNLGHIIVNNIICYIYLFQNSSSLYKFSTWYVLNQTYFLLYIQIAPLFLGYILAVNKIKKIKVSYH